MAGFPLYDGFNSLGSGPKNRGMTWQGREPRAADSLVAGISSTRRPAQLIIPTDTRTSFRVFRNYKLHTQLVAFQKRFRLLEFPLPEIRPELDRHASNAGMLQSGMPHLARFQEFHRLSTRCHRVLSRQSRVLKRKPQGQADQALALSRPSNGGNLSSTIRPLCTDKAQRGNLSKTSQQVHVWTVR